MGDGRRSSWWKNAAWIAVLALLAFWILRPPSIRLRAATDAPAASPLQLRTLDGEVFDLASLRGNVVLLNVWAGWCGPCRREIPALGRLQRELGDRGLVVLGVNIEDRSAEEIARLSEELGVSYRTVQPHSPLAGTFEGTGVIPQTWLIDRRGRVRASHGGLATERSLARACRTLLAES